MIPMQSKTPLILSSILILTIGYQIPVHAVTDAELEALEKQIEQLESEEKQQAEDKRKAEAAAKRIEEQKRKANAEAEKKRLAELEKQRIEEEERLLEETKNREEEEKKEKYTKLITEAEQAVTNKDKELAISKYNEALTLSPGDSVANSGIRKAEKLKHKVCYDVLGNWVLKADKAEIKEDGTFTWDIGIASGSGTWECSNPKEGIFDFITPSDWIEDWTSILSEDGRCLYFWKNDCWTKRD